MTRHMYCDVMAAGCGVTGLYTTLNLSEDLHVLMIYKKDMDTCNSMLTQGSIRVLRGEDDYESYFEDTMGADHYENQKESTDLMICTNPGIVRRLLELRVGFDKNLDGSLKYTKKDAHSKPRICLHEDVTNKTITTVLQERAAVLPNADIVEHTVITDILTANGACAGTQTRTRDNGSLFIYIRDTIMAIGGIGRLCQHSTSFPCLTGNALTVAQEHGVKLEHLNYVQIHPTSLYTEKLSRPFLISGSARGEGVVLLNDKGEHFANELLPRGAVSQSIEAEMRKGGSCHAWLSFAPIPQKTILEHFLHIHEACPEKGCDITKEPIPVVLAQHYFMGGVWVNLDSRTSMEHLYAVGETSRNGVHGKNRLASSSLLGSLVSAGKAAKRIENSQKGRIHYESNYHTAYC